MGEGVVADQSDDVAVEFIALGTLEGLGGGENLIEHLVVVREDVISEI